MTIGFRNFGNDIENLDETFTTDDRFGIDTGSVRQPLPTASGYNQFDVSKFSDNFLEVGLLTRSNFLVKFGIPPGVFNQGEENTSAYDDVAYLCAAAPIPGMRVATTSLRRYNYGNIVKMPYDAIFEDIELTFYVDASRAKSLDLFNRWLRATVDVGKDFGGPQTGKHSNFVSYRDDYICPKLKIYIVSQLTGLENPEDMPDENSGNGDSETVNTGNYAIVECTLHDAFPISVSPIQFDWGESDAFARINVQFSYRVYDLNFAKFSPRSSGFTTGYSYSPVGVVVNGVDTNAAGQADFLTSLTQFLGRVADTKRKVQTFKTNWSTFRNAKGGLAQLTALGNLAGPGSALNTTANQLNQIVSLTNFITGDGVSKSKSGTKKVINTLP